MSARDTSCAALALVRPCCDGRGYGPLVVPYGRDLACASCGWRGARWSTECSCGSGRQVPVCLGCCEARGLEDVHAVRTDLSELGGRRPR